MSKTEKLTKKELTVTIIFSILGVFAAAVIGVFVWFSFAEVGDDIRSTVNTANVLSASYSAEKNVRAGEIVDKRTENGYTAGGVGGGVAYSPSNGNVGYVVGSGGNKTYVPMRYILAVSYTYEYEGTVYEGTKDFEVEKEVYLAYEIGEWYDSQNFRYVEDEAQNGEKNEDV